MFKTLGLGGCQGRNHVMITLCWDSPRDRGHQNIDVTTLRHSGAGSPLYPFSFGGLLHKAEKIGISRHVSWMRCSFVVSWFLQQANYSLC